MPAIVIVCFPSAAFFPALMVRVEVPAPGAGMVFGFSVSVWEFPPPETVSVICALNPPETVVVIVEVPVAPLARFIDAGAASMVKVTGVPVTVSETAVIAVAPPEVPVTVMK